MIIIIIIILRKLELLSSEMMKMLIRDKGPVGSEQRGGVYWRAPYCCRNN